MTLDEAPRCAAGLQAEALAGCRLVRRLPALTPLQTKPCRHEGGAHSGRLRLVILEALLRAEPAFMLPPWLMAAFRVRPLPARLPPGVPACLQRLGCGLQACRRAGPMPPKQHAHPAAPCPALPAFMCSLRPPLLPAPPLLRAAPAPTLTWRARCGC